MAQRTTRPPGPRSSGLLGAATRIRHDPLAFAEEMRRYGTIVSFRFLAWPALLLYDPQDVQHVLQKNARNYDKNLIILRASKVLLGNGIFTSNGENWLHQRRIMQPAFHRERLTAFGEQMTDETLQTLQQWQDSQPFDIQAEMSRLTLRIVGRTLLGAHLGAGAETFSTIFTQILPLFAQYIQLPFPPLSIPTARNQRLKTAIKQMDTFVYHIISQHRKSGQGGDLLSLLLESCDEETGQRMSNQELRDEVLTLILGGYETTAETLTWVWYALSQNPEVEQRLHTELATVLNGRVPTVADLPDLPYTSMVIEESLRLYPPTLSIARRATAEDSVRGYHIQRNSIVFLCPYVIQRDPSLWSDPERFDPERFAPERASAIPRFAYFPFGGGPRQCIGKAMALMEAQLVLATIAQRYRLRLVPNTPVEPEALVTIRVKNGLPMIPQTR